MDNNGEEIPESNEPRDQDQDESEDYSTFFLQPASCPYNIAQKVEEANVALYNSSIRIEKSPKVRFKEDLVSFDAQLTDDDVVSIESDNIEIPFMEQQTDSTTIVLEYKTNSNIFSIDEDEEDYVIEEIECEMENIKKLEQKVEYCVPKVIEETNTVNKNSRNVENPVDGINNNPEVTKTKKKRKLKLPKFIDCKYHCLERLDDELSESLKKLSMSEKPSLCPPLKLIDRKCCSENHRKNPTILPKYDGLHSEYGLSVEQIVRKRKNKEIIRTKEQRKQEILEDYKKKKDEINEEIFSKWLKEISERKQRASFKQYRMSLNKDTDIFLQSRPVSAGISSGFIGSSKTTSESGYSSKNSSEKSRRPKSVSQSVFVEIPKNVLQRGLKVEYLLNNSRYQPKKLHITTSS
ncbi:hypothetical protein HHI36_019097 [Cryptolaemus montrouzieri]|uniref:Uncharacterized protein n=1 Tax=Cryptolaemus montrouzieri TaxID=559131 RepID=A0ABD2P1Y2_9CUCU